MAVSLMQKIRLALRGWGRRRDEAARDRKADFLRRNVVSPAMPAAEAPTSRSAAPVHDDIDLEGLQVAYLDDSGRIEHYLDTSSGEVIDILMSDESACRQARATRLYRRIPARSRESEALDRAAFVEAMEPGRPRDLLHATLQSSDAASEFRKALAGDRAAERAWYNFKNDRALQAIQQWLENC